MMTRSHCADQTRLLHFWIFSFTEASLSYDIELEKVI